MTQVVTQDWRGIAAEDIDELPKGVSLLLRRRSRALLADLLRPHRRTVVTIAISILVFNLAVLAGPWLVGVAIDRIPAFVATKNPVPIITIVIAFGLTVVVQALTNAWFIAAIGQMGGDVVLELRQRLFLHFQWLPVAFHERYTSGRVISRQVSDIDSISELFDEGLDSLVSAAFSMVFVGTGMLLLDWPLALPVLAGFVPLCFLSAWFRRESVVAYRRTRETIALVIVHFVETFNGIRAVQTFRREPRNEQIFGGLNADFSAATKRSMRLMALFFPGVTLVGNLAIGVVLLYGGVRVIDHAMQIGVLVTFLLYLRRFFEPLQDVSQFYSTFQSAAAGLEKISGVLDEPPAVPEPADPVPLPARPAGSGAGRELALAHVRFAYRDAIVLPDLDLVIPAGQKVALVGATGAGKTTIARLLARFYDPGSGQVLLDGVDLRDLADADLRHEIVLITQENFLFSATIAENIALGKPTADRAEIVAAAHAVGAEPFIEALPHGYDTQVGKRGGRLSAGQRQLISFARAFIAAPSVLLLDEATSLLDLPSERTVQQALETVLTGRTAVIIAHRLSTVRIADRVIVLDEGQVIEDGSPDELLLTGGDFADLHERWQTSLA
ncbi:MAG TPA: ABC transporter ATP-binding protein [Streptosporangiaceae bacterium]|jgi:ABC-type multidrug transport system fused ATPase/permease subunit|nr:ABC transporter ATP-binding protein [Streptosporangiaceae bacterium]